MGCDIHLFVEARRNVKWNAVKGVDKLALKWANEDYEQFKHSGEDEMPGYTEMDFLGRIEEASRKKYMFLCNGRNYDLFAALADVRNGYKSNGKLYTITPIAEPRGIPSDASSVYREYANEWRYDGHSHSYFTLAELDTSYWQGTDRLGGYLAPESFKAHMDGENFGYYVNVMDHATVISNEEMESYVKSDKFDPFRRDLLTFLEWDKPRYEIDGYFYEEVLGYLRKLGEDYGKDNVRIVFFFDN